MSALLVALLWYFLLTSWDVLNLIALLVLLLGLILLPSRIVFNRDGVTVVVTLVLSYLLVLSGVATLVNGGSSSSLRLVALTSVVVAIGLVIGLRFSRPELVAGIAGGAVLVAAHGWANHFLFVSDSDVLGRSVLHNLFLGELMGATSMESFDLFSSAIGIACLVMLVAINSRNLLLLSPILLFLVFTHLRFDLTMGNFLLILLLGLTGAAFLSGSLSSWPMRRALRRVLVYFPLTFPVLAIGMPGLNSLAIATGEEESVTTRELIWKSSLDASEGVSQWIGHGTTFWNPNSSTYQTTNEAISAEVGVEFQHAHSLYVDFYLAFGILGSSFGMILLVILSRRLDNLWAQQVNTREIVFPPLVLYWVIMIFGLTESVPLIRPNGWLLAGVLLSTLLMGSGRTGPIFDNLGVFRRFSLVARPRRAAFL